MSGDPPRKSSKREKGKLDLSPRERSILHLATLGYTDRAISAELGISKGTLGTYWNRLRMKIGPFNRTELVATVLRNDFDQELSQAKTDAHSGESLVTQASPHESSHPGTHANVLLVDESGMIAGASPTAASLFGLGLPNIIGCRVETLVPNLLRAIQTELLRAQIKDRPILEDSQNVVMSGVRQSGVTFPLTAILWPISTGDGWLVLCGLRDLDLEVDDAVCPHPHESRLPAAN